MMSNERTDDLGENLRRQGFKTLDELAAEWTGEPWPEADISSELLTSNDAAGLGEIIEIADDEAPIQEYLTKHRALLSVLGSGGHGKWVFPKLKLGEERVTDFAVADLYSSGYQWHLVELESPRARVLTQVGGEPSKEYRHAKQQIDDWRIWLRDNVAYIRQKYEGLDDTFAGVIIIGRRQEIPTHETLRKRYRELSSDHLLVMSYDRFAEWVADEADRIERARRGG
ncbi:MAG: Shedu anti-phage system protein SduA domain-containing protein [Dehalococcoidia bacterium]